MDPTTLTSIYQPRSMSSGIKNILRPNDSASLWNCTLSPGWSPKEVQILRKALMKFGIGSWSKIINSNCLPNKTNAQMNLQTQRMLGQQSTAEFAGLHVDPFEIGKINSLKVGPNVVRKNGCIINTGRKLSRQEVKEKLLSNKKLHELPRTEWESIELPSPREDNQINCVNSDKTSQLENKRAELKKLEKELEKIDKKIIELESLKLEKEPDIEADPDLTNSVEPTSSISAPLTLYEQDYDYVDFSDVEIVDDNSDDPDFEPSKRYRTCRSYRKVK